jgi:ketosteroid isomerase-like protein
MYALIRILFLLAIPAGLCHSQQLDATDTIASVVRAQQDAWNNGDLEGYMQGYWKSDSLTFIGSKGIARGWSNTLAYYRKGYPDRKSMGELSLNLISIVQTSERFAYVIGRWKLKREKDEPQGYFTLLWERIEGRWVIVADHSS